MGGWGPRGHPPGRTPVGLLTATVILPRIRSGMGPCTRFLSFSAHVPMSSMAMKTSVCGGGTCQLGGGGGAAAPSGPPHTDQHQGAHPEISKDTWGAHREAGEHQRLGLTLVMKVPKHCTM